MSYCTIVSNLTKKQANKLPSWKDKYPDGVVDISVLPYHPSWQPLFYNLFEDNRIKQIKNTLSSELENNGDIAMYPSPDLLFNAFCLTSLKKTRVIFIGQDPYFHPLEAMGLSFSVPHGMPIPSSLQNIIKNAQNNNHIKYDITHGNLEFWAAQGCLMLNTALTVLDNNKNCHARTWQWFTDKVIKHISNKKERIIFVLWGVPAFEKLKFIDQDKHEVIISSHPSGLSCCKQMKGNPSFNESDPFGDINKILVKWEEPEIIWQP
jgi:uracil-DNA glycosylase